MTRNIVQVTSEIKKGAGERDYNFVQTANPSCGREFRVRPFHRGKTFT